MERFWSFGEVSLLRREVRCARPPLFGEVSGCFARILGESWDSGLGLGLDALAILGVVKKDLLCILAIGRQI